MNPAPAHPTDEAGDTPTRPDPSRSGPPSGGPSRWRAAAAAVLLLAAGAALGVTVDRLWVAGASEAGAAPLTFEAMARSLELPPRERDQVRAVLDSLEDEIAAAAGAGPDSLRSVARRARTRLREVLPPDRRPAFGQWMRHHHQQMMQRMHPEGRPHMRGPGMRMHRGDSMPGGMMDPGGRGMMDGRGGPR